MATNINTGGILDGDGVPTFIAAKGALFIDKIAPAIYQSNGNGNWINYLTVNSSDLYVTGTTFNSGNYDLTLSRNDAVSFTESLAILASDMVVTGGTYNINTGIVTYTNNSGGTFNISGFTSGMTDTYTDEASLSGNVITFDSNINGDNVYNVDLTPLLSGKTDVIIFNSHTGDTNNPHNVTLTQLSGVSNTLFNTYTGDTQTELDNKALESHLVSHTGDTNNPHSVTAAQVGSPTTTLFNSYTGDTQTELDGKTDVTLFNSYTGDTLTALNTKVENGLNVGGANSVFRDKTGTTLNFRTLSGGSNTTVTTVGDINVIDVTIPTDTNTFVTGGTVTGETTVVLTRNDDANVLITGITSTDLFGQHTGDTSNPHSVTLTQLSGVATTLFNTYTGDTQTELDNKTDITLFNSHTADTSNPHLTAFSSLTNTAHTHTISDVTNLQTELDGKALESHLASHTGNTSNPHSVTAAQVGSPTTTLFNSYTGDTQTELDGKALESHLVSHTGDTSIHFTKGSLDSLFVNVTGDTMTGGLITPSVFTNYIDFNTTAVTTHNEGRIHWDDDDKTLNIDTEQSDVSIQVGQENVIRTVNKTGVQIDDGTVVFISGAQGNRPIISVADYSGGTTSDRTIGIATHDIPDNSNGYVTTFGLVRNYDTTSFTAGDDLWLFSAGTLTNNKPQEPNHAVRVGIALNSTLSGDVFVDIILVSTLDELHNVQSSGVTNNDLIQYNSTLEIWEYTNNLTINSVSATTISGATYYSGGTELSTLFAAAGSNTNTFITGGTVTGETTVVLTRNDDANVLITGITSTDLFGQHTGNTSNPHNVTLVQLSGVGTTLFNTYTGDTQTELDNKTDVILFNSHTADTSNPHLTAFSSLTSTGHTHIISDVTNLQTTLDTKALETHLVSHTGNTSNPHSVTAAQVGSPTTTLFNTYTGDTATELSNKALESHLVSHTADTSNPHLTAFSSLTTTGHTHIISDVTNLQTELDDKALESHLVSHTGDTNNPHAVTLAQLSGVATTLFNTYTGDTATELSNKALESHLVSHTGDTNNPHSVTFTGLTNTAHTHTISDVTNLQTTLDGKALESHLVSHTGDTNNPHNVTIAQVSGVTTTLFNTYTGDTAIILDGKALESHLVSHTGDTNNPHNVTIAQVSGVTTTLFNTYTGDTLTTLNTKALESHLVSHTGDTSIHFTKSSLDGTFVNITGDTMTGGLIAPSVSATTISAGTLDVTSTVNFASMTGSTDRLMEVNSGGTVSATRDIIEAYIASGGLIASYLDTTSFWTIDGGYTGTSITNTYQGQRHYNDDYFFEAVDDNLWIRLIRG